MVKCFPLNLWQLMNSWNPIDALIPQIPFSFFAELRVRVISGAQGSVSVGFWGAINRALFWGLGV